MTLGKKNNIRLDFCSTLFAMRTHKQKNIEESNIFTLLFLFTHSVTTEIIRVFLKKDKIIF